MRTVTRLLACVVVVIAPCVLFGCGGSAQPKGLLVSRAQYGDRWPFTVESGYIDCDPPGAAIFRTDSLTYGLNGWAKSRGFADVRPVWRDNPTAPGLKVNIGPMIDLALQQCPTSGD